MNATRATVGAIWGMMALAGAASLAGLHVNTTASMPAGIWMEHPYAGVVRDDDAVVVCLPATEQTRRYIGTGACRNGLEPLLKTVAAVAGEVVTVTTQAIAINGRPIPGSMTLDRDSAGRTLTAFPPGVYPVHPGWVWLISTHTPASYDSRYLGPVEADSIIAIGKPVWTFN